jgi:hypothetical protein
MDTPSEPRQPGINLNPQPAKSSPGVNAAIGGSMVVGSMLMSSFWPGLAPGLFLLGIIYLVVALCQCK